MGANCAIFITSLILIACSTVLFKRKVFEKICQWLFLSKSAPVVLLGTGGVWFLVNVLHLSRADFGDKKIVFFVSFAIILFLAFFKMRELLAVRGLAVLILVCSRSLLNSVYCEQITGKVFFVALVYVMIVLSLIFGAAPYMLRDFFYLILRSLKVRNCFCCILFVYGILLATVSLGLL